MNAKTLGIGLMIGGAGVNLIDAVTANGPDGGALFGPNAPLRSINDKMPINIGLMLLLIGGGLFLYSKFK